MNLKHIYMRYVDPRYAEYKEAYENYLAGRKRIADVGCGIGNFIAFDPQHIEGVDQNKESLVILKKRGFRAKQAQVTKLPYKNGQLDGIFNGHVIEHLHPADALKMLYEFDRVLKVGGVIVLKTPLMYGRFFNDLTHIRPYPPEAIMDYMQETDQKVTQRTADRRITNYKIVDLFYRYDFVYYPQLEPSRIDDDFTRLVVSIMKIFSAILYRIGIKNYFVKNGYTIVLEKLA